MQVSAVFERDGSVDAAARSFGYAAYRGDFHPSFGSSNDARERITDNG
jgi:hypothetical protein